MIVTLVGNFYQNPVTGMVVEAVARRPWETSLSTFPGRVLFAGRSARWDLVGQRVSDLNPKVFEPMKKVSQSELDLFGQTKIGRTA